MRHLFGLLTILHLFSACGQKETEPYSKAMTDSVEGEVMRYTILPDTTKVSQWTPSDYQIGEIDSLLKEAIRANQSNYNKLLKPDSLSSYYRQYICYISKGDSVVSINAFCEVPDNYVLGAKGSLKVTRFDWQHQYLLVQDGGDCYWQAVINFSKRKTTAFVVNGRA